MPGLLRGWARAIGGSWLEPCEFTVETGNGQGRLPVAQLRADCTYRSAGDRLNRLGILYEFLPSDGHDRALVEATALIEGRLSGGEEFSWPDSAEVADEREAG
ncbi:hypothetical protein NONO_c47740 [Nocardia nova SH22a]|uniref:Uncharacterized protein n=1 Tax=Nocardia nova SH22a TaxID=1415166 RepID=W5TKR9_9NOCA|nr:hypothetical protein [Nocardia nova]AHH19558.1 hypothetical protein NONO_c47740 [Nocardia nova SH22a]